MNANHSKTKKEKELADNARLLRAWKKFHREQREAVLAGPHGAVLSELFRMFANIQHVTPAQRRELVPGEVGERLGQHVVHDLRVLRRPASHEQAQR